MSKLLVQNLTQNLVGPPGANKNNGIAGDKSQGVSAKNDDDKPGPAATLNKNKPINQGAPGQAKKLDDDDKELRNLVNKLKSSGHQNVIRLNPNAIGRGRGIGQHEAPSTEPSGSIRFGKKGFVSMNQGEENGQSVVSSSLGLAEQLKIESVANGSTFGQTRREQLTDSFSDIVAQADFGRNAALAAYKGVQSYAG